METMTDFKFLGSKITEDSDCSHEIMMLASWKKSHDKTRHLIKKQRHYFANKVPYSHSYGFSSSHVLMWEVDHKETKGWFFTIWATREAFILKGINPEYSLERLMLKLKLQYFGHLMWRANSLENILILGKVEGRRRRQTGASGDSDLKKYICLPWRKDLRIITQFLCPTSLWS